jgi:hypothetical protein
LLLVPHHDADRLGLRRALLTGETYGTSGRKAQKGSSATRIHGGFPFVF